MKKPLFKPRQLLVLAYLLAAVFWVVRCLVGCGVMLNYQLQGKMPQTHLDRRAGDRELCALFLQRVVDAAGR